MWYYAIESTQHGPLDEAAFQSLVAQGIVRGDTLVWRDGMPNWQPYGLLTGGMVPPPPVETESRLSEGETVQCYHCLREFAPTHVIQIGPGLLCATCKPVVLQRMREGTMFYTASRFRYGGFWLRVVASFIDNLLLQIVSIPLTLGAVAITPDVATNSGLYLAGQGAVLLLTLLAALLYRAFFHSRFGATVGKMAMGLKLVRSDGSKVSFLLAVGRYFAEMLSGMTFAVGYLMAAWDDEKRTLHDRICDTRVIKA